MDISNDGATVVVGGTCGDNNICPTTPAVSSPIIQLWSTTTLQPVWSVYVPTFSSLLYSQVFSIAFGLAQTNIAAGLSHSGSYPFSFIILSAATGAVVSLISGLKYVGNNSSGFAQVLLDSALNIYFAGTLSNNWRAMKVSGNGGTTAWSYISNIAP